DDGNDLPPLERQDGHAVNALPGEEALVVDDGSVGARHAVPLQIVERYPGDGVAGRVEALHRLQEGRVLLIGRHE
ncbi:MAG: hypothetical protein C4337_10155, partial [Armatimonadota bacterium]